MCVVYGVGGVGVCVDYSGVYAFHFYCVLFMELRYVLSNVVCFLSLDVVSYVVDVWGPVIVLFSVIRVVGDVLL